VVRRGEGHRQARDEEQGEPGAAWTSPDSSWIVRTLLSGTTVEMIRSSPGRPPKESGLASRTTFWAASQALTLNGPLPSSRRLKGGVSRSWSARTCLGTIPTTSVERKGANGAPRTKRAACLSTASTRFRVR
jgi:hypothetical protein